MAEEENVEYRDDVRRREIAIDIVKLERRRVKIRRTPESRPDEPQEEANPLPTPVLNGMR